MTAKLIKIGNSQGVLIPKAIIREANLNGEIELTLVKEGILIKSIGSLKRKNWPEKFKQERRKKMALTTGFRNDFDKKDWQWK